MKLGITKQIGALLLIPACGALLALGVFFWFLEQTAGDSSAINVAGRQRLLSQQMLEYAGMVRLGHKEDRDGLKRLMMEFDHSMMALQSGGAVRGSALLAAPADIQPVITDVAALWQEQKAALQHYADLADTPHNDTQRYDDVRNRARQLTDAANILVTAFEARSLALRKHMTQVLTAITVFDFLLLFSGIWITRRYVRERRASEQAMRNLQTIIAKSTDGMLVTDADGVVQYLNPAAEHLLGQGAQHLLGTFFGLPAEGNGNAEISIHKDDGLGSAEMRVVETEWQDNKAYLLVLRDITERKLIEERLEFVAHYDELTGLPNRALLFDRLQQAISRSQWNKRLTAVLHLDLDRFKQINESLGQDAGNRLLEFTANRLRDCVREGDTVARLAGDEFAVLLTDIAEDHHIPELANKILGVLTKPFLIEGRELFITASIGISLHPSDSHDPKALLKFADTAVHRAKEHGRNTYQFYSPAMDSQAQRRLELESNLRRALERDEFLLYYQPKVDLVSGHIAGMEALLRWQHPHLGLVSPVEFIPLLEETGLIIPVGEWVLHTACAQNKAWQQAGLAPQRVAVNLSAHQFKQPDLADIVDKVLEKTGLGPAYLELELTESVLVDNKDEAVRLLDQLDALGLSLAIDDFGTGYSSLGYLKRFPVHMLKIDRSFINDITTNPDDATLTRAIIAMAHNLRIKVIAEGVETAEQLAFLRVHQCDEIQGYYFSRPVPADDFAQLLKENQCLNAADGTLCMQCDGAASRDDAQEDVRKA